MNPQTGRPMRVTLLLDGRLLIQRGANIVEVLPAELPDLLATLQHAACGSRVCGQQDILPLTTLRTPHDTRRAQ